MTKKRTGTTQPAYVTENRYVKNRTRKLKAHIERNPNDTVASKALEAGITYRRKAPNNTKTWNKRSKWLAHMTRVLSDKQTPTRKESKQKAA